jgi:hypothetical protein
MNAARRRIAKNTARKMDSPKRAENFLELLHSLLAELHALSMVVNPSEARGIMLACNVIEARINRGWFT